MKMLFPLCFLIVFVDSTASFGQVYITFANRIPGVLDAPIYRQELDPELNDWANAKFGNALSGVPPGTQVYNGALLEGWSLEFRAAPGIHSSGRDSEFSTGLATVTLGTGADAGYFPPTEVPFNLNVKTGDLVTVQIRVWNSSEPAATSWISAYNGNSLVGASAFFTVRVGELATGVKSFSLGWIDPDTLAPFGASAPPPVISLLRVGEVLEIRFSDHLYAAENIGGPYTLVTNAIGSFPYLLTPSHDQKPMRFFRAVR